MALLRVRRAPTWVALAGLGLVTATRCSGSRSGARPMTTKAKPLSNTQRTLLIAASARDDHLVPLPQLPAAAARQVIRSMLNAALVE
jgi:hypothetical protein